MRPPRDIAARERESWCPCPRRCPRPGYRGTGPAANASWPDRDSESSGTPAAPRVPPNRRARLSSCWPRPCGLPFASVGEGFRPNTESPSRNAGRRSPPATAVGSGCMQRFRPIAEGSPGKRGKPATAPVVECRLGPPGWLSTLLKGNSLYDLFRIASLQPICNKLKTQSRHNWDHSDKLYRNTRLLERVRARVTYPSAENPAVQAKDQRAAVKLAGR